MARQAAFPRIELIANCIGPTVERSTWGQSRSLLVNQALSERADDDRLRLADRSSITET